MNFFSVYSRRLSHLERYERELVRSRLHWQNKSLTFVQLYLLSPFARENGCQVERVWKCPFQTFFDDTYAVTKNRNWKIEFSEKNRRTYERRFYPLLVENLGWSQTVVTSSENGCIHREFSRENFRIILPLLAFHEKPRKFSNLFNVIRFPGFLRRRPAAPLRFAVYNEQWNRYTILIYLACWPCCRSTLHFLSVGSNKGYVG